MNTRQFNIGERFNIRQEFGRKDVDTFLRGIKPPETTPWPPPSDDDGGDDGGDQLDVIDAEFREITMNKEPLALPESSVVVIEIPNVEAELVEP